MQGLSFLNPIFAYFIFQMPYVQKGFKKQMELLVGIQGE